MEEILLGAHDGTLQAVLHNHAQASLTTRVSDSRIVKVLEDAVQKLFRSIW